MTDLEALIAQLEAGQSPMSDPFVNATVVIPIARELVAARKVVEAARDWKFATIAASKGGGEQEYDAVIATGDLFDALIAHDAATSAQDVGMAMAPDLTDALAAYDAARTSGEGGA